MTTASASLLRRFGSWGLVLLIVASLVAWMATGIGRAKHEPETAAAAQAPTPRFTVFAREQRAENVRREIAVNGTTTPDKLVEIAAQLEGQIVAVGPRKGARLTAGEVIARIDARDLEPQKVRAQATLRTRDLECQAALKMRGSGYVTEGDLAARLAALETARADLAVLELRQKNLVIATPAAGILEDRLVEVGDYAKAGQIVARVIEIDPLIVSGTVNENDIRRIRVGDSARAQIQSETLNGRVRFVSSMADEKTRTFTVEVAVDNPGNRIPAGLSARVTIPVQTLFAHRIPASLLTLADDGAVGVKHVVAGKVVFTPAQIVRADGDAVWVDGLPSTILLITRGQGFVAAGSQADVQMEAEPPVATQAPARAVPQS